MMDRRKHFLDPNSGPKAQLAFKLRGLRQAADLTYEQIGRATNYHPSTFCLATGGERVPSWDVTEAFIKVCEEATGQPQDRAEWKALWMAAANGQAQS